MRFTTFVVGVVSTTGLLYTPSVDASQIFLQSTTQNEVDSDQFGNQFGRGLGGMIRNPYADAGSIFGQSQSSGNLMSRLRGHGHGHGHDDSSSSKSKVKDDGSIINFASKSKYPRIGKQDREAQIFETGMVTTVRKRKH